MTCNPVGGFQALLFNHAPVLQIQLVLNTFSVGCAGFSVLTPYRALFLGLTASSLGWSHLMHRCIAVIRTDGQVVAGKKIVQLLPSQLVISSPEQCRGVVYP